MNEDDGDDLYLDADEPTTVGEATAPGAKPPKRPLRAVLEVAETLRQDDRLGGAAVGVLHGRMSGEEKDQAIADFASGATPVLVSTTVIEVGVDVPAATVMVVLDAHVFGLSQLHQLRGRIGRGREPGICLLVSDAPDGSTAGRRLEALSATTDGFELARVDLLLRREGDVLGAAQSGRRGALRFLRVVSDGAVIDRARDDARALVDADPELTRWPALRRAIDDAAGRRPRGVPRPDVRRRTAAHGHIRRGYPDERVEARHQRQGPARRLRRRARLRPGHVHARARQGHRPRRRQRFGQVDRAARRHRPARTVGRHAAGVRRQGGRA